MNRLTLVALFLVLLAIPVQAQNASEPIPIFTEQSLASIRHMMLGQTTISGASGFGTLQPGTNTSTGAFQFSQAGVFTSTQFNIGSLTSTLLGGGSCSPNNITNLGGTTFNLTDAISACVNIPTSGVTNAFTNGYGAYMTNPNANATGQFGFVGAVGYYSQVWCTGGSATNTKCWGANFSVSDKASLPAVLIGNEYDVASNNTTTLGFGTLYSFRGAGQPTTDNFPAIAIQAPQSTATFTTGFECQSGSISSTNNNNCLQVGQIASGLSQNSDAIRLLASDASAQFNASLSVNQGHWMYIAGMPLINYGSVNTTYGGGFGITLKSTAAIGQNLLVKADTTNTDSVVICATTDTTACFGFTSGANSPCGAGSTFCNVIATPGSFVQGILGTGTCAIGNFVIVDTTTNGRIKCVAAIPAQGAYIGVALSAQATVGNNVDILTKFQ